MSFEDMSWHQDVICNMVANSHFIINDIVTTYTQYKKSTMTTENPEESKQTLADFSQK